MPPPILPNPRPARLARSSEEIRQKQRLIELETTVRRGLAAFAEAAGALRTIRDERLYRHEFGSFDAYCRSRFDWSRRYVNRLLKAEEVVRELGPIGPAVTCESHARALLQVPADLRREVVQKLLDAGLPVTEPAILQAGREVAASTEPMLFIPSGDGALTEVDAPFISLPIVQPPPANEGEAAPELPAFAVLRVGDEVPTPADDAETWGHLAHRQQATRVPRKPVHVTGFASRVFETWAPLRPRTGGHVPFWRGQQGPVVLDEAYACDLARISAAPATPGYVIAEPTCDLLGAQMHERARTYLFDRMRESANRVVVLTRAFLEPAPCPAVPDSAVVVCVVVEAHELEPAAQWLSAAGQLRAALLVDPTPRLVRQAVQAGFVWLLLGDGREQQPLHLTEQEMHMLDRAGVRKVALGRVFVEESWRDVPPSRTTAEAA